MKIIAVKIMFSNFIVYFPHGTNSHSLEVAYKNPFVQRFVWAADLAGGYPDVSNTVEHICGVCEGADPSREILTH